MYNVEKVINYILHTCYRYTPLDHAELYNIGYLGYLKAEKNFNPEYGTLSVSYATFYIKAEINMALKAYNKQTNSLVLFENKAEEEDSSAIDQMVNEQTKQRIKQAISILPKRQQFIIQQLYCTECPATMPQIAENLGLSKQRVFQLKEKALEMMKKELVND